mmetsp:Transcript_13171/g.55664  ORF Transcript_13171/g.55664 Transcript_13171/m.55664 type:complete len:267 (+) Transcript_13171:453-1253(+)
MIPESARHHAVPPPNHRPTRPRVVVVIVVADDCPAPDSRLARQEPQQLWPPRRAAERREQVRRGGGNRRRDKGRSRAQRGEAIGALVAEIADVAANLAERGRRGAPAEQEPRGARQRAARGGGPGGGPVARASRGCVTARCVTARPPTSVQRRTSIGVQRLDYVRAVGVYFHRRTARVSDERDEHGRELREVVVVERRRRERGGEVQRMTDSVPDADARGFALGDASIDKHRRAPGRRTARVGVVATRERWRRASRGRRRPEQQRE